jgi:tRNA threonylcarbamoyl adenosine modification protein (Sua5/YciO/YrdC/YwlC family)
MAERILIDNEVDITGLASKAADTLREGNLIIAPMEHAYVFVADAFNHGAVKKMHILRGDSLGTAAQVIVADSKTARGITQEFGSNLTALCERFWPGLLTVKIAPAQGLVWDLGDARTLPEIAIRVPENQFLRAVAAATGPLAVASASTAGSKPRRSNRLFPALDSDYTYLFDAGELPEGLPSTVIAVKDDGVALMRAGAISLAELREVTPNIAVPA